ncbi:MAG: sulfite exporter TauE/SafE family protein [Xenococcaceae cyanobacterium]
MIIFWLTLASFASWFVSTLGGGGTPLLLIPAIGLFLGSPAVPPVLTTGMLLGHPQRVFLYWRDIDWRVMWWYLPGAVIGAGLGAFVFTQIQLEWLPILLALFLICSTFSYGLGGNKESFQVRAWYFLPAGFIYAFLSGLVGSTGPLLNPFYLNYGLVKEQMIATKSANMVVVHVAKIIIYASFGALTLPYLVYGSLIGIAAFPGNWIGQMALKKVSEQRFQQLVVVFVAFSGMLILWEQRDFFAFW